jgi:hypothetical protein
MLTEIHTRKVEDDIDAGKNWPCLPAGGVEVREVVLATPKISRASNSVSTRMGKF